MAVDSSACNTVINLKHLTAFEDHVMETETPAMQENFSAANGEEVDNWTGQDDAQVAMVSGVSKNRDYQGLLLRLMVSERPAGDEEGRCEIGPGPGSTHTRQHSVGPAITQTTDQSFWTPPFRQRASHPHTERE